MTIFIGADHRGFELKEQLKPWLTEQGHDVVDCGNTVYDKDDDFPDFAFAVADNVAKDLQSRGIVICGSGVGVNVAANRVKGVRCSTGVSAKEVHHGREHDDLNVLALSADYISVEENKAMIETFLETEFTNEERHVRRLNKILAREREK